MRRKGQTFLQGAAVLMAAVAAVKVLGALFKIPLSWILTPVGSAYFGSAYALYFPIYSLAVAGFPTAIARMVSARCAQGRYRDVRELHRVSTRLFLTLGLCAFGLMLALSVPYAALSVRSEPQTVLPALWALAPSALFCSLLSIYRGLYEGLRNMTPTAVSQIVEAACKLVFGLGISGGTAAVAAREYAATQTVWGVAQPSETYARLAALPACAAGAVFGVTIGSAMGFLYLFCYHRKNGDGLTSRELRLAPPAPPGRMLLKELLSTAVPIALGSLAVNLSTLVDAALLNQRLSDLMQASPGALLGAWGAHLPQEVVRMQGVPAFLYGCYTNANTLFMLVPAVTQAFAMSALPSVTAAWAAGSRTRLKGCVVNVIRLSALLTIPAGMGLAGLAQPVCAVLFGEQNAPAVTAAVLRILGIAAVFSALCTPVQSMLQAVGRTDLPVKLLFGGLAVKAALNYVLVGDGRWNVRGAAVSTLVCYGLIFVLSLIFLLHETKIKVNLFALLGKPLLGGCLSVACARLVWAAAAAQLPPLLATAAAVAAAVAVYAGAALLLGAVKRADLAQLTRSRIFSKRLEKT